MKPQVCQEIPVDWFEFSLELTGSFEGGSYDLVAPDFDGQGLSVGILQFNAGQGTLSLLLSKYLQKFDEIQPNIFPKRIDYLAFASKKECLEFVRKIMLEDRGKVKKEWYTAWKHFLRLPGCIECQREMAKSIGNWAAFTMEEWGLYSLRAFSFFFDVRVQHGSLRGIKPFGPSLKAYEEVALRSSGRGEVALEWPGVSMSHVQEEEPAL